MKKGFYLSLSAFAALALAGCNAYQGEITTTTGETTSEATSTQTSVETSTSLAKQFTKKDVDVLIDGDGAFDFDSSTLTAYYKEDSQIPYVSLTDMFAMLNGATYDYEIKEGVDGMTTLSADDEPDFFKIDAYNDTILTKYNFDIIKFEEGYAEALTKYYTYKGNTIDEAGYKTLNLADYGMEILEINDENTIKEVVPYYILGFMLLNASNYALGYTGKIFYLAAETYENILPGSEKFDQNYLKTKEVYTANYNFLDFYMNNYYGLNMVKSGAVDKLHNLKKNFLSANYVTRGQAMIDLDKNLNDPHSSLQTYSILETLNRNYATYSNCARSTTLSETLDYLAGLDGSDTTLYHTSGDTYFIRIDSFMLDLEKTIDDESNTHIILEKGIKAALEAGYKNIVVDVSENTGGYVVECARTLQYFISDTVNFLEKNYLNGSTSVESFKFDLNKDDVYDEKDTYAGKANYYIQTSAASFSCGNLFPCVLKDAGIKIIGQKCSGGACNSTFMITPSFSLCNFSGVSVQYTSTSENVNDPSKWNTVENGAAVDIAFSLSKFRDYEYIDSLIKSNQ